MSKVTPVSFLLLAACLPDIEAPYATGPCPEPPPTTIEIPPDSYFAQIIEGRKGSEPIVLDGPTWNRTLIRGCQLSDISGDAIRLKNVQDVWIVGCEISGGTGGIRLLAAGRTSSITIANNHLSGLRGIAIAMLEGDNAPHIGARIIGNRLESVGLAGAAGKSPAMLLVGRDYLVEGNTICEAQGGDGMHVGGPGRIVRNSIRNAKRNGIRYVPPEDGFPEPGGTLVIENNLVFGIFGGTTLDVLHAPGGVDEVHWNFNTAVHFSGRDYVLRVGDEVTTRVHARGNLLIHVLETERAMNGTFTSNEKNYVSDTLDGFVSQADPLNMHLTTNHAARGFANGLEAPSIDIDGDPRPASDGRMDPGADQSP